MNQDEYQKQLIIALQQQREQACNQIAHLAALVTLRDSEIAELKKPKADATHQENTQ